MNKLLVKILEIANESLKKYLPEVKKQMLEENGKVYYMNYNDGTLFDWNMNERLCEFMMFYNDSGMGAIKINVLSSGTVTIYLYKNNEKTSYEKVSKELFSREEALELAILMYNIADKKKLFGKAINNMQNITVTKEHYDEFKIISEE